MLTIYRNSSYAECTTGTGCLWNREHTWAKSYGFAESENSGPGRFSYTDCHHLRAADPGYNSTRGNKPFNDCTSGCNEKTTEINNGFGGAGQSNWHSGTTTACNNTPDANDLWQVWDHRKGDVARSILYMDIRYEGDTGVFGEENQLIATDTLGDMMVGTDLCGNAYQSPAYHGILSTLIEWHNADPVDAEETSRNEQVWCHQGNRNPFVDHPEWVRCVFLEECDLFSDGFESGDASAWSDSVP